jgi:hypothetical protein
MEANKLRKSSSLAAYFGNRRDSSLCLQGMASDAIYLAGRILLVTLVSG